MIGGRLGNTLFLAAMAALVAVPIAVGLGILAARFRETWFDKAISIVTLAAISMPEFFIGYLLIYVFAVKLLVAPRSPASTRAWRSARSSGPWPCPWPRWRWWSSRT